MNAASYDLPGVKQHRVVFLDGVYSEELSRVGVLPAGVRLENLSGGSALSLSIPDKAVVEDLFHILFLAADEGNEKRAVSYSSNVRICAGVSTRLKVIVEALSPGESRLDFETRMAPGACVNFYELHRGDGTSIATNRFYLKRHCDLEFLSCVSGGVVRHEPEVHFEEEHGFCALKGLSVLDDTSRVSDRILVSHGAPHCISRQFYKNILAGKSKSEFDSFVEVLKGAVKSDSRQLNKNILLSDTAEARTRPTLRIDADDVSCTHGATVGQLEKDELFYLTSRGLSEAFGRYLLTYGFAEELLEGIEPEVLKGQLERLIKKKISNVLSLRGVTPPEVAGRRSPLAGRAGNFYS